MSARTLPVLLFVLCAGLPTQRAGANRLQRELPRRLVAAVEAALGDPGATVRVVDWHFQDAAVLETARALRSLALLPGRRPVGAVTARARLATRGGGEIEVFVLARVDVSVPVWVASTRIARGAPLSDLNVRVEQRPMRRIGTRALRADVALTGRVAARALMRGAVLTSQSATTPVVVKRGDDLRLTVRIGAVSVAARGEALHAGRVGDRIPVRIDRSRRTVRAWVTGFGVAEVRR